MFEQICNKQGKIKVPANSYSNGVPAYTVHNCRYCTTEESFRSNGKLKTERFFMLKGLDKVSFDAAAVFCDEKGKTFKLSSVQRIDNLFTSCHECYKITVK